MEQFVANDARRASLSATKVSENASALSPLRSVGLLYTPATKQAMHICFDAHIGQTDKVRFKGIFVAVGEINGIAVVIQTNDLDTAEIRQTVVHTCIGSTDLDQTVLNGDVVFGDVQHFRAVRQSDHRSDRTVFDG